MIELSVIITTTESDRLPPVLDTLRQQTLSTTMFEVIIAQHGQAPTLDQLAIDAPFLVRWLHCGDIGAARARAQGVTMAHGRFCLLLGATAQAVPELLEAHLQAQREHDGVVGLGCVLWNASPHAAHFTRARVRDRNQHANLLREGSITPDAADARIDNLSAERVLLLRSNDLLLERHDSCAIDLVYELERAHRALHLIPAAVIVLNDDRRPDDVIRALEQTGAADVAVFRRWPALLARMELGGYNQRNLRELLLRWALLTLGAPHSLMLLIGSLIGARAWSSQWYDFVYRYCYWRGVRRALRNDPTQWRLLTGGVVVLMYHACGKEHEPASRYVLPGRQFARQMAWLRWRGYRVISLDDYLDYRAHHRLPPARCVVITFDDGYADNREVAAPVLTRYGFPATIFCVTRSVGRTNNWDTSGVLANRPLLHWDDMLAMQDGKVTFGAHTRSHVPLVRLPVAEIVEEVQGGRGDLAQHLGQAPRTFAYPHGQYDDVSRSVVARAGFSGICTSHSGLNDPATPPYRIHRTEVRGTDSLLVFGMALCFGKTDLLDRLRNGR